MQNDILINELFLVKKDLLVVQDSRDSLDNQIKNQKKKMYSTNFNSNNRSMKTMDLNYNNNNQSNIKSPINSRPISAAFRHPYTSSRPKDTIPPIINTMPNNPKLIKNIGLNIDKEQLNESNVQLKIKLNKLKQELADAK